jgi:transposase
MAAAGQSPPQTIPGVRPADRIAPDKAAMLALPPVAPVTGWEHTLRLPRDHYVRLNGNDYSVHPSAVGHRILVRADLDRVQVWCEGDLVADHERIWARHQTISDPAHLKAARMLRQQRFAVVPPASETEVEQRRLADYDTALGVGEKGMAW